MKIGLDLRMVGGGSGIDRYISEVSKQILTSDRSNTYVLFFNRITAEIDREYRKLGHEMVATGIGQYSFAEQLKLPGILNRHKLDLVHFPHFNVPLLYRRPFVVTIHDLTHTKFPGRKKSRFFHRLAYNLVLHNAVKRAKRIIAVSESTKREVVDYFKLDAGKVKVVYEGASSIYSMVNKADAFDAVSKKFGIKKPYLLYVGVWRRYKNLSNLAQAFDRIADKHGHELVLAGAEDPFYPEIKEQVMAVKNSTRIKATGRVSDSDLKLLYNAADLVVLPSLHEGFGLTVLEAAACGTPVACSDIPTLREVMGQAAEYFDPANIENMADVISDLLSKPPKLEELANLGLKRVNHFDWKIAGKETLAIYMEALR